MADDLTLPETTLTSPADLYFQSIGGGDLAVTTDQQLSFPMFDTSLNTSASQDGTTGDSTSIFTTLSGVAGSFLKAFTGSSSVSVGTTTPKPPVTATNAAQGQAASLTLLIGGGIVLIVMIMILGKR